MAMDGLFVPIHAPWFAAFKTELMSYPAGRNDDQVDALGLIGQVLDKMVKGNSKAGSQSRAKVLSTDPSKCTVTLEDVFQANESPNRSRVNLRIH